MPPLIIPAITYGHSRAKRGGSIKKIYPGQPTPAISPVKGHPAKGVHRFGGAVHSPGSHLLPGKR